MGIKKLSPDQKAQILIVEDEVEITRAYQSYLKDSEFDVHITNSAQDAWRMLDHQIFHLIITDLNMPHLDGEQFIQIVRKNHAHKEVPIIIASGAFNKVHESKVERDPNLQLIKKPFGKDEFLEIINQTLK